MKIRDMNDLEEINALEDRAYQEFRDFLEKNKDLLCLVSSQTDGQASCLIEILKEVLLGPPSQRNPKIYNKKPISQGLRTQVFERDAYRCVICGSWEGLCADHIYPESRGGEASLQNLQTLCRTCNSKKGAKLGSD